MSPHPIYIAKLQKVLVPVPIQSPHALKASLRVSEGVPHGHSFSTYMISAKSILVKSDESNTDVMVRVQRRVRQKYNKHSIKRIVLQRRAFKEFYHKGWQKSNNQRPRLLNIRKFTSYVDANSAVSITQTRFRTEQGGDSANNCQS